MNKVLLIGRLTRDPDVRYSQNSNEPLAVARYTLAVDRDVRHDGNEQSADFIVCVAFGKNGEFAEKYLKQGMKIAVEGRIQTGNYTNKDGVKIYTTEVLVSRHEFCESKRDSGSHPAYQPAPASADGFMNIPDGIEEEDKLPFK